MSKTKFEEVFGTETEEQTQTEETQSTNEVTEESDIKTEVKDFSFVHKLLHPQGIKGWAMTIGVGAAGVAGLYFGTKALVKVVKKPKLDKIHVAVESTGLGEELDRKVVEAGREAVINTLTDNGVRMIGEEGETLNELADDAVKTVVKVTEDSIKNS